MAQPGSEGFQCLRLTTGKAFNPPIRQIAHPAVQPQLARLIYRGLPEIDALYAPSHDKAVTLGRRVGTLVGFHLMGILNRIRKGLEAVGITTPDSTVPDREELSFAAEVPVIGADAPLWKVNVHLVTEPHGDGERLRLRAHVQTNFAALRPALAAPSKNKNDAKALGHGSSHKGLSLSQRTTALAQRALENPVVNFLAQPLLKHDFNTWIDVQASTASLDAGAHALVPQSDKLSAMGIRPARSRDGGPVAESWSGQSPSGTGLAQVSIVQIEKKHLPARLARMLGDKPFQMAGAVINTVEEK